MYLIFSSETIVLHFVQKAFADQGGFCPLKSPLSYHPGLTLKFSQRLLETGIAESFCDGPGISKKKSALVSLSQSFIDGFSTLSKSLHNINLLMPQFARES